MSKTQFWATQRFKLKVLAVIWRKIRQEINVRNLAQMLSMNYNP